MKKVFFIITAMFIAFSLAACAAPAGAEQSAAPSQEAAPSAIESAVPAAANDAGYQPDSNEVQTGDVCGGDGYIFFTMEDQDKESSIDNERVSYIYASRPDGSEKETIFKGYAINSLTYLNGWLYFMSDEKNMVTQDILRIRPDGSGKEDIFSGGLMSMAIYGDKIFALSFDGDYAGTYSMDLDGQNRELLFKHLDGDEYEMYLDTLLGVNKSWLIYHGEQWEEDAEDADSPNYYVLKKNIKTGEETSLFECECDVQIQLKGNMLYYIDYDGIHRIDLDTENDIILVSLDYAVNLANEPYGFCITDNILLYTVTMFEEDSSHLYGYDLNTGKTQTYSTIPRQTWGGGELCTTKEGLYYACLFDGFDFTLKGSRSSVYRLDLTGGEASLEKVAEFTGGTGQ